MASWEEPPLPRSFDSVFYGAAGTSTGDSVDDEFNRVSFLSHFEGANNGVNNAFDDGSADNRTITTAGNMAQGSFGPFCRPDGEWGVSFDGNGDRLRTNSSNLDITTEAFTAEAWIFPVSSMDQYDIIVCMFASSHGSNANQTWSIRAGANNTIEIVTISSGTQTTQSAGTANIGAWNHVALSRNGTTMYAALNGAVTSKSCASSLNGHEYFYIGAADANGSGAYFFNGVISNVRYEIGNARYTSNYTVPTSKLTATTNTKILTCQSNRFVDNSTLNNTFLISGNPAVTAFGPFLTSAVYAPTTGASAYFNASSAILVASPPSFGPQSWTFECWFYFTGDGTYRVLLAQGPANGTDVSEFYRSSDNKLTFQVATSGANRIIMNTAVNVTSNNEWVHCALTHEYTSSSNSTYKIYQNGILGQTLNHTGGYNWASGAGSGRPIVIGRSEWEGDYNSVPSYVQDSRLVVGSVVYTGNFTPPTAPLTAITNTKLLLNMADGQAIDSAAQNNLTLDDNTKISNGQAKFGNTSLLFDGTNDYATTIFKTSFGAGNFTIEYFFRVGSVSTNQNLFQFGGSFLPDDDGGPGLGIRTSRWRLYTGSNTATHHGSAGPSNDTWYHIAVVRNGTTTKLYVDGVETISVSDSYDYSPRKYLLLGGGFDGSYDMNGYMDEFRVSYFARYTSNNFTVPSEPFADKGQ